jgi:hypothetical protein
MSEGGTSFYSSVFKSQLGYSWRVKEKVAKQLYKNQELLAVVVAETPVEGYSKVVLDAENFAPVMGLSWGGDEKSLLDLFLSLIRIRRGSLLFTFLLKSLRGRGSSKIWNVPLILRLEA